MDDDYKKLMARDPAVAAMLRKTTSPSAAQKRGEREEGGTTPTRSEMTGLASSRIRTIRNSERIFQALPELETIITIATSSLLSTKDLINTTLIYENVSEVPLDLRDELVGLIRDYNDHERKLPTKLYKWMYDANRSKGATPVLIISDSGFDEMFKLDGMKPTVAGESTKASRRASFFEEQLGILLPIGAEKKQFVGIESILNAKRTKLTKPQVIKLDLSTLYSEFSDVLNKDDEKNISLGITDNPRVLLLGDAYRRVAGENARNSLYGQLEQAAYETPQTLTGQGTFEADGFVDASEKVPAMINLGDLNEVYNKTPEQMHYVEMPKIRFGDNNKLEFIERVLPAECTLPLILAGDVMNPIGYLTIVDEMGNFINAKSSLYGDANFMNYLNNDGMSDSTINRANMGMGNSSRVSPDISNRLTSRFGELAENQLTESMSEALGGAELDVTVTEMFGRVILTRHLAKRYSQVVYIPAENLSYFATDFDDDGIGVSITERSFVISTVRMALLFATMNSAVLNSARHMQYDIILSPDAMNGQEAVDRIKSDIINGTNRRMPMWGNMEDVWSMATNSGIAFNVEGNEHYASHKVSVSDTTPDYKVPDAALDENLLRRTCHLAGVDPDLVMTPENIEFASQIFSKSLLVTQQITKKQEILVKPLTRYVVNGMLASPRLQARMIEAIARYITGNEVATATDDIMERINEYMRGFINGMVVRLPPPDTSAANSQMDLFDKRMEFFEKLADLVVTDDLSTAMSNEGVTMTPDELKTMVKSYYARSWLMKQGMETEFFDMFYDEQKRPETVKAISDQVAKAGNMLMMLAKRTNGKIETIGKKMGDPEAAADASAGGMDFNQDANQDDSLNADDDFNDDGNTNSDDLNSDDNPDLNTDDNPDDNQDDNPDDNGNNPDDNSNDEIPMV